MLNLFRSDPDFIVDTQVRASFKIKGSGVIEGVPDAVVIDKAEGIVRIWECKGGMCSSYTPNQREYIGMCSSRVARTEESRDSSRGIRLVRRQASE
jgi:hypothetical protein